MFFYSFWDKGRRCKSFLVTLLLLLFLAMARIGHCQFFVPKSWLDICLPFFFYQSWLDIFICFATKSWLDIHLLCNTIFFLQIKHMTIFFVIAKNWQLNIYKIQNNINKSMITAPLKNFHTFISPENNCIHIDILVCCSPLGTDCFT